MWLAFDYYGNSLRERIAFFILEKAIKEEAVWVKL